MTSTEEGSIAIEDLLDLFDYEQQVRAAADRAFRVFTSARDLSLDEEIDRGANLLDALCALHLMDGDACNFKDVLGASCEADGRSDLDIIVALRSAVLALLSFWLQPDGSPNVSTIVTFVEQSPSAF